MAIIWFEHFDLYGGVRDNLLARGYDAFPTTNHTLTTASRTGSHCLQLAANSTNQQLARSLPVQPAVAGVGCAIQPTTNGETAAGACGVRLGHATGTFRAVVNSVNGISLYNGSTLLASSAPALLAINTYTWLELKANSTEGTLEARVNGIPAVSASGLTFGPLTNFGVGKTSGATTARFDDVVVWDNSDTVNNDWIGDTFVLVAPPTADGAINEWAASTGTDRWALIDEAAPSETDFISAAAVGQANEFAHAALNLPAGSVAAIGVQARAYKNDAGASSVILGIASGSQTSMSGELALSTGVVGHAHIANRNPNGNVPWTQSAAQAARLRVQRVT